MRDPEEQRRLESWKEISDYLRRSIRTCRRWETELGLPIHRLDGTPSARVFAYPQEIDRWMEEKLDHVKSEARRHRPFWTRITRRLVLVSGTVIALGIISFLVRPTIFPKSVPSPSDNPILAILPFENLTGDEVLESWRTAFPDLLITDLMMVKTRAGILSLFRILVKMAWIPMRPGYGGITISIPISAGSRYLSN